MEKIVTFCFLLVGILAFNLGVNVAAEPYPVKSIRWVVPFNPGGGVDVLTRALVREMGKDLNVPIIVQNIPGGGARIGAANVFTSKPDGYTLGTFVVGTLVIPQVILGNAPYDVRKFVWVGSPFSAPFAVWAARKSPLRLLKDLKNLGRPPFIAEVGLSGTPVPPTVLIMKALDVQYKYVTGYGGQAVMNPAVISGEADLVVRTVPSQQPWKEDLRNIATLDDKRHPLAPDVPTVVEQLGPIAEEIVPLSSGLYLIGMPPGTPASAAQVIEKAILKALDSPSFLKWAEKTGFGYDVRKAGAAQTKKIVEKYIAVLNKHEKTMKEVMTKKK
jgi:tripartite-type tricarboxylate transporter receptor subunit TctC